MKNVSKSTNLTVKIGLLSAIALILMYFEFPVLPAYSFLKIDLSDIPALIGAFAFGPFAGIIIEAIKNLLVILTKGTQTGGVGELANFVVGCAFVGCAGIIYKRKKTRTMAVIALVSATIFMAIAGVIANYFVFVPLYFKGAPSSYINAYMIYGVIPLNLIKGIIISVVTLVIYKRISVLINSEVLNSKKLSSEQ